MKTKIIPLEGNKMIAEFMGFKNGYYPSPKFPVILMDTEESILFFNKVEPNYEGATWKGINVKFDSSWDWLMPAWSKFYIAYDKWVRQSNTPIGIKPSWEDSQGLLSNYLLRGNIDGIYSELVGYLTRNPEFIKWYNNQNKK